MTPDGGKPGEVYRRLIGPIWGSISIYDGPETFLQQFRLVRPEVRNLFAAHWCQSEVRNGGLHQFFANPTGVLAPEAVEGFRAIGLEEWTAILEEAMRFFDMPYPREQAKRREKLSHVHGRVRKEWDPFSALDTRFYQWLHAEADRWARAADAYASQFPTS
jgi:hypothetical protein